MCVGLDADSTQKQGQIAHLDGNPGNNTPDNLAFLCLIHHDQYDSRTSQSKGLTEGELREYRSTLYAANDRANARARVRLVIELDPKTFNATQQASLTKALALLLSVSPDEIRITQIEDGSVKVTLSLPREAATALLRHFNDGSPAFDESLNEFPVRELHLLGPDFGNPAEDQHQWFDDGDSTPTSANSRYWITDFLLTLVSALALVSVTAILLLFTPAPASMWWLITLSTTGGLAVLFLLGRRNERSVRRDWELLLTPSAERLYHNIAGRVTTQLSLAVDTQREAQAIRELGSVDEAIRLLDCGYRVIEKFAPSMLSLLAAMATFSRIVTTFAPVRPLRPTAFRLPQLVSLAFLNQILHQFLVSRSERFRLRLYVLGKSFGLLTRHLLSATQEVLKGGSATSRAWDEIDLIYADFHTLKEESLSSLSALLASLAADRREEIGRFL